MLEALLNLTLQTALLLICVWVILAVLGIKWRLFRGARHGYGNLLKAVLVSIATWLWAPEMERQGGGSVAQMSSELNESDTEGEEWESDQDGWL